jgi:plastocyanin
MKSLSPKLDRQGVDYGEKANVHNLHAEIARDLGDSPLTIQPFSLWVLIVCGLGFFFTGFFWSRYETDSTDAAASPGDVQSTAVFQTSRADASPARTPGSAESNTDTPAFVRVVMRNMKFEPATVEVKSGGVVEWKNEDITPHTATSVSFDSASIDPDTSWRHTFSAPGTFPYSCTFHPDMKAVVNVK